jgi:hypothetical protein
MDKREQMIAKLPVSYSFHHKRTIEDCNPNSGGAYAMGNLRSLVLTECFDYYTVVYC